MLEVQGATVRFGALAALEDLDLSVADGEVVAVLGASGSGKTTLLRAVAGLQPLDAGRILWDGSDLAGVPSHRCAFLWSAICFRPPNEANGAGCSASRAGLPPPPAQFWLEWLRIA